MPFKGGGEGPLNLKRYILLLGSPQMLAKILPPDLTRKAFQQIKDMKVRDLLFLMSRDCFTYSLRQLGHTAYIFGTPGNGMNVEHEMRIRIKRMNHAGLSGSPKNCMPNYLATCQ